MPKFDNVSCSSCGQEFGPGDHGFSHCEDHQNKYNQRDEYFNMLADFVAKAANETGHYHRIKALESVADMVDACKELETSRVTTEFLDTCKELAS